MDDQVRTDQVRTVPISRVSVPALLVAAAGTAAVVSFAVLNVHETTAVSPPPAAVSAVADEPLTRGEAYAEQLEQWRHDYLDSVREVQKASLRC